MQKDKTIVREIRHLITYNCNLKCLHCYLSAGEHSDIKTNQFSQKEANKFYDYFKPETISVTGGEPLLYPRLVKILARSTAKYNGKLELVTNGLLLTPKLLNELNDLNPNISYQISLDGNEKFHDYLRQKKGAYKGGAIKAIDLCSASRKLVKARMTVTPKNYNQIQTVINRLDKFERKNIKLIMRAALDKGRAHKNNLSFGNDFVKELEKFKKKSKFIDISITERCGYCLDSISVDPSGEIYPCCYFVFNPEYKMGNMFNPQKLERHPDFLNYTGKCFAVEKFSKFPPKSRCKSCIDKKLLKPAKE